MCRTHVKISRRKEEFFLVLIIEERSQLSPEERPNDMLLWLMKVTAGEKQDPRSFRFHVLIINFAATHTTSRVSYSLLTYIRLAFNILLIVSSDPMPNIGAVLALCSIR